MIVEPGVELLRWIDKVDKKRKQSRKEDKKTRRGGKEFVDTVLSNFAVCEKNHYGGTDFLSINSI